MENKKNIREENMVREAVAVLVRYIWGGGGEGRGRIHNIMLIDRRKVAVPSC